MATIATLRRRRAAAAEPPATFEEDLLAYLGGSLPFPAYPGHVPQLGAVPCYSFGLVAESPYYLLAGPSAGLTRLTYQFDCWSTDRLEAARMQISLRALLHGFRGPMGSSYVSSSRLESRVVLYEPNVPGTDQGTYHEAVEYRLIVRDPVFTF